MLMKFTPGCLYDDMLFVGNQVVTKNVSGGHGYKTHFIGANRELFLSPCLIQFHVTKFKNSRNFRPFKIVDNCAPPLTNLSALRNGVFGKFEYDLLQNMEVTALVEAGNEIFLLVFYLLHLDS